MNPDDLLTASAFRQVKAEWLKAAEALRAAGCDDEEVLAIINGGAHTKMVGLNTLWWNRWRAGQMKGES